MKVDAIGQPTEDVRVLTLSAVGPGRLPSAEAGAHIDLYLPEGMIRPYSLLRPDPSPKTYEVAVKQISDGRGGSMFIHSSLQAGTELKVSHPRNSFSLNESAPLSIFVAGGIGITPIWSMLQRMRELGRPWKLHYACRSNSNFLFYDQLRSLPEVTLYPNGRRGTAYLDLPHIVSHAPVYSHLYCCGPTPLLDEFKSLTEGLPVSRVHTEAFSSHAKLGSGNAFVVKLARSGQTLTVESGRTILQTLREHGINAVYSCEEGICGVCETAVLAGIPDHRDAVLSDEERAENTKIMICCSRSLTGELVLDI